MHLFGLGSSESVPASPGVSADAAKAACLAANGQWTPYAGYSNLPGECLVQTGPDLPSWCGWMPLSSLFSACKLPDATDLANISSYTAFQIGQKPVAGCQPTFDSTTGQMIPADPNCTTSGAAAEQQAMNTAQSQSDDLIAKAGCNYAAAVNYPLLSDMLSPSLVRMLTNPLGNGCTAADGNPFPGWMLYLALGVGGFLLLNNLQKR